MKKFEITLSSIATAVVLVFATSVVSIPSADAGVVMIATASPAAEAGTQGLNQSTLGTGLWSIGILIEVVGMATHTDAAVGFGLALFALDADGSLPQDYLAEALSKKYPFIDNTDVTHELASLIGKKFVAQHASGVASVLVSLAPSETLTALLPASLTDDQQRLVVTDLR